MEAIVPGTAVSVTSSGNMTMQNSINTITAFDVVVAMEGSGTAVVKGNSFNGNVTAFEQTSGTLIAYANNIAGYTTALNATGGSSNLAHNWWGKYSDPIPPGLDVNSWDARLGAPVVSWTDGDGTAVLGAAQLTGGSGTAVIVSHGRANWPFGVGIIGSANMMCSDYYDFFTVNGGGTWSLEVPVDNTAAGNLNTLAGLRLFWIPDILDCNTPNNSACWDLVTGVTANGQNLVASNLTEVDLGGTPFVAGDSDGFDPTAITLQSVRVAAKDNPIWLLLLLGFTFISLSFGTIKFNRRSNR
jgi:hypothetical protein